MSAELSVILLTTVLLLLAYFWLYPRVAGADLKKVALLDGLTTVIALGIVGTKYWQTEQVFELAGLHLNWFWFTLACYLILEIPLSIWYLKRFRAK
ncbi:hypothetical protein LMJ53_00315 [Rheinheimera sp. UJ51]|uniref:hypothetical protein n=1 Tax=unclassified Rheinheimera TaxID=115860 RepID=UPI001E380A9A|nr:MULTISPECIES: hypothetical protein [unclassified Rheinheimera]MCC5450176.1 hypothetical protein [Rheinheimera sp. UJ51]MCF4009373.1 hypothetical protein [Rheinheimera sp. UJ63]